MSIRSTKLSTIINRMDRYQAISQNNNTISKVRDIDEQIRVMRRLLPMPWCLKKTSLRVFDGVYTYPVESDHDELAYLDVSENVWYPQKARFRYTSLQQFFEDSNNRNTIAEIWDGGERKLGVNYKEIKVSSQQTSTAEIATNVTVTGDSGTPVLDEVFFKEGNGSIRVQVNASSNVAGIRTAFDSVVNDADYLKKYYFKWVYLSGVPSSIDLYLETNSTNYLWKNLTAQFDGSAFKTGQWNLLAMDLSTAGETGTFDETSIAYDRVILYDAPTGLYYFDSSYLRGWQLMDFWYYSIYSIRTTGATSASKEYFFDDDAVGDQYTMTDELLSDSEWIDVIQAGAMYNQAIDIKDKEFKADMLAKLNEAVGALFQKYPSMDQVVIQDRYNFVEDFLTPEGNN